MEGGEGQARQEALQYLAAGSSERPCQRLGTGSSRSTCAKVVEWTDGDKRKMASRGLGASTSAFKIMGCAENYRRLIKTSGDREQQEERKPVRRRK